MITKPTLSRRAGGVLLHPTSLAGPRGGDLGPAAMEFVEFLADCGQSWWQMLPISPPDWGGSPYNSPSSFAGSPELISADLLAAEGLLKKAELGQPRSSALRVAFSHFRRRGGRQEREDFEAFRQRESWWLADHALFCALKDAHGGRPWVRWAEPLRRRQPAALGEALSKWGEEVQFHEFCQWIFARQWLAIRRHAAVRGVGLMGDAPIYVSHDSADCWAHQELFYLDDDGQPTVVAGVPPDYFSKTGQLWGNPIYRWERHSETGFSWWISRLRAAAERFDALRLDHFIGFRNYWEVPASEKTAVNGRWVQAPGEALFTTVRREVPDLEILAEDLGTLTDEVAALRDQFHFPGMKIAQFSFGGKDADLPSSWPEDCVGYSGTHDNEPTRAWFEGEGGAGCLPEQTRLERETFLKESGGAPEGASWAMLRLVWKSPAKTAVAPMQDLLDLGAQTRMNRPGTCEGNWRWRMEPGALSVRLAGRLGTLTGSSARAPEGL